METIANIVIFVGAFWFLVVLTRPVRYEMRRAHLHQALLAARRAGNTRRFIDIQDELYRSDERAFIHGPFSKHR